jgi:hypothetical protein
VIEPSALQWRDLRHAYGPATDIPELLVKAQTDMRRGHIPDSTWFCLWSALCHQGDAYSASHAAVPYLVGLAGLPAYRGNYDPLLLASSIEASRLAGRGPALAPEIGEVYRSALEKGLILAHNGLEAASDLDSRRAFGGCVAVLQGELDASRALWDADDECVN